MSPRPAPAQPAAPRRLSGWRASYARFCSKRVVLAVAAFMLLGFRTADLFHDPPPEPVPPPTPLTTAGIEAQIRVGIAVQLRARDTAVEDVTCTRDSPSRATCEAEMSGEAAGNYEIAVRIAPGVQILEWHVVGRLPSRR